MNWLIFIPFLFEPLSNSRMCVNPIETNRHFFRYFSINFSVKMVNHSKLCFFFQFKNVSKCKRKRDAVIKQLGEVRLHNKTTTKISYNASFPAKKKILVYFINWILRNSVKNLQFTEKKTTNTIVFLWKKIILHEKKKMRVTDFSLFVYVIVFFLFFSLRSIRISALLFSYPKTFLHFMPLL